MFPYGRKKKNLKSVHKMGMTSARQWSLNLLQKALAKSTIS